MIPNTLKVRIVVVGPAPGHDDKDLTPLTMNELQEERLILYYQRGARYYLQHGLIHYIFRSYHSCWFFTGLRVSDVSASF